MSNKNNTKTKLSIHDVEDTHRAIWFYKRRAVIAVRDIFGINLAPHQRITIRSILENIQTILLLSRGMGKTFIIALAQLYETVINKGMKVVAIGGGAFRQSKFIAREAETIIKGDLPSQKKYMYLLDSVPDKKRPVLKSNDEWRCLLGSGVMYYVPPKANIRGYRGYRLYIDEANEITADIDQKVIKPFANVRRSFNSDGDDDSNKIIYSGTITYTFEYYYQKIISIREQIKRSNNKHYGIIEFNYEDAFRRGTGWVYYYYPISIENIEGDKDDAITSIDFWAAENKNKPINNTGGFYPLNLVAGTMKKKNPAMFVNETSKKVIIGIDPARSSDNFAIVALLADLENKKSKLCNLTMKHRESYVYMSEYVYNLATKIFPNSTIYIDLGAGGAGKILCDLLADGKRFKHPLYNPYDEDCVYMLKNKEARPQIRYVVPSNVLNHTYNLSMKAMMEQGQIILPQRRPDIHKWDEEDFNEAGLDYSMREFYIEQYKIYEEMIRELTRVKMTKTATSVAFGVTSGKKDLYSALLYAANGVSEFIGERAVKKEELPSGFWA